MEVTASTCTASGLTLLWIGALILILGPRLFEISADCVAGSSEATCDEYPYERHYGATMMGARPIKKLEEINRDYGFIPAPVDHDRRIHLGWRSGSRSPTTA